MLREGIEVQFSQALNPRRISRSLVTVLVLTLFETVAAPIIAPHIAAPASHAVTGSITAAGSTTRSFITIPAGVESITLTVTGGGGGKGGSDVNAGGKGGMAQRLVVSFAVTPGDVVSLFPGNAGNNGLSGASTDSGGTGVAGVVAGGASTLTDSFWNVNGTSYQNPSFSGGASGKVGALGSSGSGGGGGAASVVAINRNIVAVAGGAGGGGGAGSATNAGGTDGVDANTPNSNLMYGGAGKNSGAGLNCSASDGGSGGGGGGGYLAGIGGFTELVGNECSGRGGYRGNALVYNALSSTNTSYDTSSTPDSPLNGTITYTYDVKSSSACTPSTTTVDIYTVLKFDASVNCTWTVPSTVSVIDIFAVGGGGGGGHDGGTGGGGGAGLSRSAIAVNPSSNVTIRVAYGGRGGFFNAWESDNGETSSVTTSTGAVYNAPGGSGGGNRATGKGAGGAASSNGTFAGGAGGLYPASGNVGSAGSYGISNYFFGSQNTYAGGGGGGCYFDTYSNVSGAIGRNGGGAGCSNTSAGGQVDATNGTAGTGGGGGGGGAGPAGRVISGKGGSGVILIRYATNSADSFPASLSSAVSFHYSPGDMQVLDSARKGWIDSSGNNASVANANFTGSPTISTRGSTDGAEKTDSSKSLLVAKGGTGDRITLRDLPNNYTLFSITRYVSGGSNGRLITASGGNWFSGHYYGMNGCAHHNTWLTGSGCNTTNLYGWQLDTDQLKYYRQNGVDVSMNQDAGYGSANYLYNQSTSTGFGINNDPYGQNSNWELADLLVFNRQLTAGEIRAVENWIARVNGLTLNANFTSSETDTAGVFAGSNYYYGQYLNGMYLNDTFTVEGWVNPNSYCDGSTECPVFSYEDVLVTRIYQGTFWYALRGSVSGWQWTDTKAKFPSGEWHHFSLSKRLTGNQANAVDLYRDGNLVYVNSGTPYLNSAGNVAATNSASDVVNTNDTWFYIGARSGAPRYYGQLDEIKVWKVSRTGSQIASDLNSPDATSPNLQLYYDFNRDALSDTYDLQNLAWGGQSRSDMVAAGTENFQDVKTTTTSGAFTTITFPRTYITQNGGWKVPTGISQVQTVVVGGGGGGGGGYQGGGGGAGGFIETLTTLVSGTIYPVIVGTGGRGTTNNKVTSTVDSYIATNGDTTTAFGFTSLGGGRGASEFDTSADGVSNFVNTTRAAFSGGSGGGAAWGTGNGTPGSGTSGQGNNGGLGGGGGALFYGGGGGGAGSVGKDGSGTKGGNGGAAKISQVTGTYLAGGGGGAVRSANATTFIGYGGDTTTASAKGGGGNGGYSDNALPGATGGPVSGTANTGGGGGAGLSLTGTNQGYGATGGSGIVALRYITALKPTYTKPTTAYLNVGMTETFTTNVAVDSATVGLTRTFKWESTTPTSSGNYTVLKTGTGAANAAYSWVPTDTSTTGAGFLYRLTVTDSDTAGLFITDSSTAYAVINPALVVTSTASSNSLNKKINVSRSETFTITLGTPTYRATLSPVIAGITIDTSTAGSVILKIGDTVTVGTYSETLTVTDSVSATNSIPLTIKVQAPASLTSAGEIVKNGQVLNLDAGNSNSIFLSDSTVATNVVWNDLSGSKFNATTSSALYNSTTCNPPTYSTDNGGILTFSGAGTTCYQTPYLGTQFTKSYTIEAWVKLSAPMTSGMQIISQAFSVSQDNIGMAIGGLDQGVAGAIFVGFFDGTYWRLTPNGYTPTLNTWFHILGTYDGANMNTYINGSLFSTVAYTGGATIQNTKGFYIGKRWDGSGSAYHFSGSIGEVRAYNRALTATEVTQNYTSTNFRYQVSYGQNIVKPTQKYGTINIESFTATSGGDTKTVTLTVGNRAGILWDTATAGVLKLIVQETLTPGTYLDTITVVDNFGTSTILPIKFTVNQADTLTVYVDTPTALSYTGSQATFTQTLKVNGLVGLESGTATSATVKFKPAGTTCATGGYCRVGDIGPGGGIVFIDTSTASSDGRIYEVAPANWSGSDDLSTVATYCSNNNLNLGATQIGIGWGDTNTTLAKNQCLGGAVDKVNTFNQSNTTGYSDWFIPSRNEAGELIKIPTQAGLVRVGANWTVGNYGYWTSTEQGAGTQYSIGGSGASWNNSSQVSKSEATRNMVRPVRAFKSCWAVDTCTSISTTSAPTFAGVYSIVPSALTVASGSLNNYVAVSYVPTPLTINKVAPASIVIPVANSNYPETFTVNVSILNGSGSLTFTTTNGTASGCALDYRKIYSTSQGTCNLTIVRAADRNFTADTTTAAVFFLTFVSSQPTNQSGSGAGVGVNGATPLIIDSTAPPTITGISWVEGYTLMDPAIGLIRVQAHYEITGTGFGLVDNSNVTIKFWRNKSTTTGTAATGAFVANDALILILLLPSGVTPGRFAVITPNGEAVSNFTFTP